MHQVDLQRGMSLIELMIVLSISSIIALGTGSYFQQLNLANKNIEQKQLEVQLMQEIGQFLSHRDTCTINFGSTKAPPAINLSMLPYTVPQLMRAANPAPVAVYRRYDGTDNTLLQNGHIRLIDMKLSDFVPILDAGGNPTNFGEAMLTMRAQKNSASVGSADFRMRQLRLSVTLNAPFDNVTPANNVIAGCVAMGFGGAETIWVRKANNDIYYLGGLVGVGIPDPLAPFHVQAANPNLLLSTTGVNQNSKFQLNEVGNEVGSLSWRNGANERSLNLINRTNGPLTLHTNNSPRMTINQDGNVGIATETPGRRLEINNLGQPGPAVWINGNDSSWQSALIYSHRTDTNKIFAFGTRGNIFNISSEVAPFNDVRLAIDHDSGNVGIGLWTPTARLDVGGSSIFRGDMSINGNLSVTGTVVASSDENLKREIKEIGPQLSRILEVPIFTYQFKSQDKNDKKIHYGVIAQKLQKVYPDLVIKGIDGNLAVNYTEMVPLLIKSMQEMQTKITELEKKIKKLESR